MVEKTKRLVYPVKEKLIIAPAPSFNGEGCLIVPLIGGDGAFT
jgi:hypothetical protein